MMDLCLSITLVELLDGFDLVIRNQDGVKLSLNMIAYIESLNEIDSVMQKEMIKELTKKIKEFENSDRNV